MWISHDLVRNRFKEVNKLKWKKQLSLCAKSSTYSSLSHKTRSRLKQSFPQTDASNFLHLLWRISTLTAWLIAVYRILRQTWGNFSAFRKESRVTDVSTYQLKFSRKARQSCRRKWSVEFIYFILILKFLNWAILRKFFFPNNRTTLKSNALASFVRAITRIQLC